VILEQWQVLYGTGDGSKWLVARGPYGYIPPNELDDLPLLGETSEIIRTLMTFRVQAARRARGFAQADTLDVAEYAKNQLAKSLGITPGQLITYANDEKSPELSARGWQELAKAYYFMRGGHETSTAAGA
jgi:protein involved in sex pheromone biosynthesis